MIATLSYTFVNVSQLPTIAGVDPTYVDMVLAGGFLVRAVLVLVFAGKKLGQGRQEHLIMNAMENVH